MKAAILDLAVKVLLGLNLMCCIQDISSVLCQIIYKNILHTTGDAGF